MLKIFRFKFAMYLFFAVTVMAWAGVSWATPLGSLDGSRIILIDGDGDLNTKVTLLSGISSSLSFGYFLDGGSDFTAFGGIDTFEDRAVLDLALFDSSTLTYYRASEDLADSSFSLSMDFGGEVGAPFSSQQPLPSWLDTYYTGLIVTWNLPSETSFSMNFSNTAGDGIAPVPEPASLILMGSGLAGLGLWRWRKSKKS